MTSPQIHHYHKALLELHPKREWAVIFELRIGTGYGHWADKSIDAFAINCWPSKGNRKIAYEIKRTRGDFLNELKQPLKRHPALMFSNEFYFVVPDGFVQPDELPQESGLIQVSENGIALVTHKAPYRDAYPCTWPLFASIARRLDLLDRKET